MVMLKVTSSALLFFIRLDFQWISPSNMFYDQDMGIQWLKIDFALQKCKLDLLFLGTCLENHVIPKFLNFCVSNLHLKASRAYHVCQLKLLLEEISLKRSRVKTLEKDFNTRKKKLRGTLGIIDCTHVCCLFLNKNDKTLKNKQYIPKLFTLEYLYDT